MPTVLNARVLIFPRVHINVFFIWINVIFYDCYIIKVDSQLKSSPDDERKKDK